MVGPGLALNTHVASTPYRDNGVDTRARSQRPGGNRGLARQLQPASAPHRSRRSGTDAPQRRLRTWRQYPTNTYDHGGPKDGHLSDHAQHHRIPDHHTRRDCGDLDRGKSHHDHRPCDNDNHASHHHNKSINDDHASHHDNQSCVHGHARHHEHRSIDHHNPAVHHDDVQARSRQVIEPAQGEVVEEFFDIGQSRSLPWKRRPEAARLLDTFRDPKRGFDAVVIGEPQRAFYGNQFGLTFPVFVHYGIGLWVPEVGGAVDPGSDAHDLVMSLYGGMSKGERNRIKTRVRAAMASQAAVQGRFLGGRPPYGYVLADAGAHPNPSKAAVGQRLHVLAPDPTAAPVVGRIFDEFVAGSGLYAIAEGLT